jgi:hypothetical protein
VGIDSISRVQSLRSYYQLSISRCRDAAADPIDDGEETMNVFLIGAGFTKAVVPESPLNSGLLKLLAERSHGSGARNLRDRYGLDEIEIALTRLDMDISAAQLQRDQGASVEQLKELRKRVETELVGFFGNLVIPERCMQEAAWLRRFVTECIRDGDVVISLNYDCILEQALDIAAKWSPNGGYGESLDYPSGLRDNFSPSPVTVLKIHGSANFVTAPVWGSSGGNGVKFLVNEAYFPRSGKNMNLEYGGLSGQPYLIAPSYIKIPAVEIVYLMLDALAAASCAARMVIVGSSLRAEDGFLPVLLTTFLRQPGWKSREIVVVGPHAQGTCDALRRFWATDVGDQIVPVSREVQESLDELLSLLTPDGLTRSARMGSVPDAKRKSDP